MAYGKCWVTLTYLDAYGRNKVKRVELSATDAALAETAGDLVYGNFAAVTEGQIQKVVVSGEKLPAGSPTAGSNADTGVTVSCSLSAGGKAALKWPMPTAAIINADGSLDLTDVDVQAVETLFQAGGGALLSDGETIDDFLSGKLDK